MMENLHEEGMFTQQVAIQLYIQLLLSYSVIKLYRISFNHRHHLELCASVLHIETYSYRIQLARECLVKWGFYESFVRISPCIQLLRVSGFGWFQFGETQLISNANSSPCSQTFRYSYSMSSVSSKCHLLKSRLKHVEQITQLNQCLQQKTLLDHRQLQHIATSGDIQLYQLSRV